jgi:hypothetical protein
MMHPSRKRRKRVLLREVVDGEDLVVGHEVADGEEAEALREDFRLSS